MPTPRAATTVNIRPGVSILSVLRHLNYRPWFALAEFVDNAIQSAAASGDRLRATHGASYRLRVEIDLNSTDGGTIRIADNAAGIGQRDYSRAFRPAEIPPDRSGLSEFGMGMKSAACWFAPRWTVRTKALGESATRTVDFDIDRIVRDDLQELAVRTDSAPVNAHFTEIVLRDLFKTPQGNTVKKIREHLASIYRVFLRAGDPTVQSRGHFRGFDILSKGKTGGFGILQEEERIPELFIRGRATYSANLNATNPVGTVQSIEHALRSFDKLAAEQHSRVRRVEKELADYQAQSDRPFEHEERLRQLLARQAELNSQLDLDKGDQQGAAPETSDEPAIEKASRLDRYVPSTLAKMAEDYMRASGTAIRELPITQLAGPESGSVRGRAVAKDEMYLAIATSANRFVIVDARSWNQLIEVGEHVSLQFRKGRSSIDPDSGRER